MPRKSQAKPRTDFDPAAADQSAVRQRVLAAFSARARRSGIRAVLMGDLASELRMSAMTLYKHFPSKEELVAAMVDAWALELAAIEALDWDKATSCSSALQVLLSWADAWTASLSEVSPHFFLDLRRDHPEAYKRFQGQIGARKEIASKNLTPFLREDINPAVALLMLDKLVTLAADPRFANRTGVSRREAVRSAVVIWGDGALKQRVNLRGL